MSSTAATMIMRTKTPSTIPTRVNLIFLNILSDADSTYHSNLVSCQSSRVINFVDVDPGGDSLIPVLTILTLSNSELWLVSLLKHLSLIGWYLDCVALQIKAEWSRLRVGVNTMFWLKIIKKLSVNSEGYLWLPVVHNTTAAMRVLKYYCPAQQSNIFHLLTPLPSLIVKVPSLLNSFWSLLILQTISGWGLPYLNKQLLIINWLLINLINYYLATQRSSCLS